MKFLFLGNDASLKLVNWDLVRNSSLYVVGINRSYLVYPDHDLLFAQDPKPILELLDQGYTHSQIRDLNVHTTHYFRTRMVKERNKKFGVNKIKKKEYEVLLSFLREGIIKTVRVGGGLNPRSPFSILNAMGYCYELHKDRIKEAEGCTYYLYGCGLKHRADNNHFWQNSDAVRFPKGSDGGSSTKQLNKQAIAMNNLKPILLAHKIKIVSCNESSRVNRIFPHEPLTEVLLKNRKLNNE
jgi:hypothetical protein